jgi:hypothetical protein
LRSGCSQQRGVFQELRHRKGIRNLIDRLIVLSTTIFKFTVVETPVVETPVVKTLVARTTFIKTIVLRQLLANC